MFQYFPLPLPLAVFCQYRGSTLPTLRQHTANTKAAGIGQEGNPFSREIQKRTLYAHSLQTGQFYSFFRQNGKRGKPYLCTAKQKSRTNKEQRK